MAFEPYKGILVMPAPTVAFVLFDAIFQYLETHNIANEALCNELKIKSKKEVEINGRIPLSLYENAFLAAEKLTGDCAIGMNMGHAMYPASISVFHSISIAAENVKQILEALTRFFPIAYDF